ncbi:MAG: hypothetical protein LQ343_005272 [Gyalolechia ehrenbergii]|nr:MAG: hypothetical protein LQ343_005272 [Gyalolechia ehrenbergii]
MATAKVQDLITILLIQGSFQIPQVYDNLTRGLSAQGYQTIHPQLPSCTDVYSPDFPQRSLADDAAAIYEKLLQAVEDQGKTVLVVMHSYGGLVGGEAVPEELTYPARQARGKPGGIVHFFFYSAFLLDEGQSVLSAFGESPNNDVKPDGRFYLLNGAEKLYNDLPPSEASLWASRLIPQSHKVEETQLTRAAWRYVPSTYLICEGDQAAPPQYQEMFAEKAGATVERCSSGHSPHLGQPQMLVQKVHEAAQRAVSKLCPED